METKNSAGEACQPTAANSNGELETVIPPVALQLQSQTPFSIPNLSDNVIVRAEHSLDFADNFAEIDEETSESVALVEQALSSIRFKEAGGFTLKHAWSQCYPILKITPTLGHGNSLLVRAAGWEIDGSSIPGCYCCCMPSTRNWQTITLKQNNQEIVNFMYRPRIWCFQGKQERIVDIYIPQREKRIGWIKLGDKFYEKAVIADCVNKSIYITQKIDRGSGGIAMNVISNCGVAVAEAQATRGWRRRGFVTWTEFEMKYSSYMVGPMSSSAAKAAILVAFAMWVLTYREDTARQRMTLLFCFIILAVVVILFSSFVLS